MVPVKVRGIEIGGGRPKICVPVVGKKREEILAQAKRIAGSLADIAEWRADWYEEVFRPEKVGKTLEDLRTILNDKPLLFTFRTQREGGEKEISGQAYNQLVEKVIESGFADMVDIEYFTCPGERERLLSFAASRQVKTILSSHDFQKTPPEEELIGRLKAMEEAGGDIAKIAVMPRDSQDVLILLGATEKAGKKVNCPVITMSMGKIGVISRICGEATGSALTFGTLGEASAPGQMELEPLRTILEILHRHMQ